MTECWLFAGKITEREYGMIYDGEKWRVAHRVVYESLVGEIPDGLVLDHLCRVKQCVNPEHLEPVPHRINTLRGIGPTAVNKTKTHCINGHEFTPDNVYIRKYGWRGCRTCERKIKADLNVKRRLERQARRAAKLVTDSVGEHDTPAS